MGNSSSTTLVYDENIDENVKEEINDNGDEFFAALFAPEALSPQTAALVGLVDDVTNILPFTHTVAGDMIDDQMRRGADMVFAKCFNYLYSDQPDQCLPPGAIGLPKVASGLCSISTPIGNQVTEYIQSGPVSKWDLPASVERQAIIDLICTATKLVNDNAKPTWSFVPLNQTYDSVSGDQSSWRCNVVFLYVTGGLTNDGLRAGFSMIYYLGAFFSVQSDNPFVIGMPEPEPEVYYPETYFYDTFRFKFRSVPPDSLVAEGVSSAYLQSNSLVDFIGTGWPSRDQLKILLDQGLFNGLNVPVASIKTMALEDLTDGLVSFFNNLWFPRSNMDKFYMPADPTLNPIRLKSINMGTDEGLPAGGIILTVLAVFYEELPAEQRAVRRLFQILCDKLLQELQRPPPSETDFLSLKEMLLEYTGQKFNANFGFAYNGNESKPPDQRPGGAVRGYEELFHISYSPAAIEDVENWLNAEVFLKDSLTFPAFANNKIWEKIRDDVVEFAKTTTAENWLHMFNSAVYLHPEGGTNIKQYSQYVYAVGDLELDGVKVTRVFVCYLGVFCGTMQTS